MVLFHNIFPFLKKLSLAVIYVEYGATENGDSDRVFFKLQEYLSKIKGCRTTYLRIDNKYENIETQKTADNTFKVGGDNTFREFSGWQKGVEALNNLKLPCDLVLITNEMFLKPGPSFLQDYASIDLLERSLKEKKIIGRIDTTHQEYRLFGYDVSNWICTNCFLVPKAAVDRLGNFVLVDQSIKKILKERYEKDHHITTERITPENYQNGRFLCNINLPSFDKLEIRVAANKSFMPNFVSKPYGKRPCSVSIEKIAFNEIPLSKEHFIWGTRFENGSRWAEQNFLLGLPKSSQSVNKLTIEGLIPHDVFEDVYQNNLELSLYNDSLLFQENAPINDNYKRWLVEWLTERWHSKFQINQETWETFQTKTAAILNESLLTAKFKELGYNPETYGDKKYY